MPSKYTKIPKENQKKPGRKPDPIPQEIQIKIIQMKADRYQIKTIAEELNLTPWRVSKVLKNPNTN